LCHGFACQSRSGLPAAQLPIFGSIYFPRQPQTTAPLQDV